MPDSFRIDVHVPARFRTLRERLEEAETRFLHRSAEGMARALARAAPGGESGRIGRSFRAKPPLDREAHAVSDHPAARALDKGATIRPRHGRFLRFQNAEGRFVFVREVTLEGAGYVQRALATSPAITQEAFEETHDL